MPRIVYEGEGALLVGIDAAPLLLQAPNAGKKFGFIQVEGLYGFDADWTQADSDTPQQAGWFSGLFAVEGQNKTAWYKGQNAAGRWHRGLNPDNSATTFAVGAVSRGDPVERLATVELNPANRQLSLSSATPGSWTGANRPVIYSLLVVAFEVAS